MHQTARRERNAAWLFLAPAIAALLLVAAWPLARTIYMSFTDANFTRPGDVALVGFRNYLDIFHDRVWWRAVGNTLTFTLASVAIETVLGLAIALLFNQAIPGRGLLRASILIPWAIPAVVSAKIWEWMLNDQFGLINEALESIGLIDQGIAWIAEPHLALWVVVFVDVWITTPFMVLLILAGLQMIPREITEAAYVDGVPAWRRLVSITLPLLRPAIGVAILFRTLDALRMFDLSYMLAGNSQRTMTISVYARNELISFQEMGLGSAASTWVFGLVGLIAIVLIGFLRLHRSTAG
jgi:trehalose/maltose transport system permease protein